MKSLCFLSDERFRVSGAMLLVSRLAAHLALAGCQDLERQDFLLLDVPRHGLAVDDERLNALLQGAQQFFISGHFFLHDLNLI
jgi:hypothetical protein